MIKTEGCSCHKLLGERTERKKERRRQKNIDKAKERKNSEDTIR